MQKPVFSMLAFGFALLLGACGKDNSSASNSDNLTSGQWKLSSSVATFTFNGLLQTVDVYAQLAPCEKDNIAEFKTDGTLISDEGPTKCGAADPQQETGTWTFAQNETHLIVSGVDYDFDAEIIELTDTKLHVKYDTNLNGIVTTTNTVFVKIQ